MGERELGANRAELEERIAELGSVVVAFSGGVDSTLLLAVCLQVLGRDRVLAVTVDSPIHPSTERDRATEIATLLGARHRVVHADPLSDPDFRANSKHRCYFCKRSIMELLHTIAEDENLAYVVHGANTDDLMDYRPGAQAAEEAGARAPLQEVGLSKGDIRAMSREMNLPTWDLPSMACLASRFPYGTPLTAEGMARVGAAEGFLRETFGLRQLRVRDHFPLARIEVPEADLPALVRPKARRGIVTRLRALGYAYVALDLQGFRSGSLNEVLERENGA